MAGALQATRRRRGRRPPIVRTLFLAFFVLLVLVPLYWVFVTSIKPSDDYLAVPPVWFPEQPTIVHYTAALFAYRGLQGLINSIIISVAATILSCLVGTMMAYSLARFQTTLRLRLAPQRLVFTVRDEVNGGTMWQEVEFAP